ncbi:PREDICTED: synaptonemal complex protein 2-like, partial [Tauraco erythrolophus]|uniref:synaptonemal complex protein 2-like n=1 Tax=Tauraco erythrolophus TaxID=121530 RepID=UPI000523D749
ELDKNEFQNVSLLLKCIQLYLKSDLQEGTSLFIEQGLVEKMSIILLSWFERARGFVNLIDPNQNKFLMLLLEDFFDSALVKLKVADEYACTAYLCKSSNAITLCYAGGDYLPCAYVYRVDYDLQVALSEALCRLMTKKWREDLVHHWFEDNYLAEAFKEIKDREFETDCRKFLNQLNERLGGERRKLRIIQQLWVFSGNGSATIVLPQVKKPSDEKLEEFWIDFNAGSQSVTFYVDSTEGALWDSVRLLKEAVSSYSVKEDDGQKIVKIYMKIPATLNKTEVTKIKMLFSAEFEILSVLRKVLGDEKMMVKAVKINEAEEESVHAGKQVRENEAAIPESANPQGRRDPSNSENTETLSGNLASPHRQELTGAVTKMVNGVTMITVSQQTDVEDGNQGSGSKSMTLKTQTLQVMKRSLKPKERFLARNFLHKIRDEILSEELEGGLLSVDESAKSHSSDEEKATQKFNDASDKASREEGSLKRKDSGVLSGTVTKKPKLSSQETSNLASDVSYKPRKLFDSVEKKEEIQTGQEMDGGVGDAFFSKILREDDVDSGVITAFESFTGQLKKLFSSRYKRMETSAQNALRTSEKNMSGLPNQIHECRLSKLETFKKIIVEELASLEKETQVLANMEKDAMYELPMEKAVENSVFVVPSD